MARCPDCSGEMKYRAPFMVCLDCGLSFKRSEVERMEKKIKDEFRSAVGPSEMEAEREDRQKKRDYYRWLVKKEDD